MSTINHKNKDRKKIYCVTIKQKRNSSLMISHDSPKYEKKNTNKIKAMKHSKLCNEVQWKKLPPKHWTQKQKIMKIK